MSGRTVVLMMLLCCFAGAGCSDKNSVPGDILSQDKMEQVMWDMAQADQYAALYLVKDSALIDRKTETMRLYAEVLRLHQVTPEEFRKSYRYYLSRPELNQLLFDSVVARGVRARTEMYDRPSTYRAPLPPANVARPGTLIPGAARPGVVTPVRPGLISTSFVREPSGAKVPNKDGRGTMPGRSSDSVMRAMRAKRDTTGRTKGRPGP